MTDDHVSLEAPDADAQEQSTELVPEPDDDDEQLPEPQQPPLEADEADIAEQERALLADDDDDYR